MTGLLFLMAFVLLLVLIMVGATRATDSQAIRRRRVKQLERQVADLNNLVNTVDCLARDDYTVTGAASSAVIMSEIAKSRKSLNS